MEGEYIASLGRDDLDVFFPKNNSLNLLKKKRLKKKAKSSRPGLVRRHGTRQAKGLFWELIPGPLAPEARIMPPDQTASGAHVSNGTSNYCSPCCQPHGSAGEKPPAPLQARLRGQTRPPVRNMNAALSAGGQETLPQKLSFLAEQIGPAVATLGRRH